MQIIMVELMGAVSPGTRRLPAAIRRLVHTTTIPDTPSLSRRLPGYGAGLASLVLKMNKTSDGTPYQLCSFRLASETASEMPLNLTIYETSPEGELSRQAATTGAYAAYVAGVTTDEVTLKPLAHGECLTSTKADQGVLLPDIGASNVSQATPSWRRRIRGNTVVTSRSSLCQTVRWM